VALTADDTTPPQFLQLPALAPLPAATVTRPLSLNEEDSQTVFVTTDESGNVILDCDSEEPFGPREALLGTVEAGEEVPLKWEDEITENPAVGATELWEFYNLTADAHPMHIHEITFEIVNREGLVLDEDEVVRPIELDGNSTPAEPWESGFKDTFISYPGQVTRVKAQFNTPGQFVWHCHIVEHEDNEMMRPYSIGPPQSPEAFAAPAAAFAAPAEAFAAPAPAARMATGRRRRKRRRRRRAVRRSTQGG
jgi:hypothetical protein